MPPLFQVKTFVGGYQDRPFPVLPCSFRFHLRLQQQLAAPRAGLWLARAVRVLAVWSVEQPTASCCRSSRRLLELHLPALAAFTRISVQKPCTVSKRSSRKIIVPCLTVIAEDFELNIVANF